MVLEGRRSTIKAPHLLRPLCLGEGWINIRRTEIVKGGQCLYQEPTPTIMALIHNL